MAFFSNHYTKELITGFLQRKIISLKIVITYMSPFISSQSLQEPGSGGKIPSRAMCINSDSRFGSIPIIQA